MAALARWNGKASCPDPGGGGCRPVCNGVLGGPWPLHACYAGHLVQLTLGEVTWESSVWFCDPWPLAFHLLGQEGFLRWFDVRVRAAVYEVEIEPEASV